MENGGVNLLSNGIKASCDELIIDTYEIVFQKNITALNVDANFSIYKVEYNGTVYTVQQIRDAPNTGEIAENISDRMSEEFNETISSVFPEGRKKFYEMDSETGSSGPINFSTSADYI